MIRIWFKPNCSTCRTALQLIKGETEEAVETYEYLREKPTQKDIREIVQLLRIKPEDLVRKKEQLYKENFEGKKITQSEWIRILALHPILIERPIIIKGNKALLGRPATRVLELF